MSGATSSGAFDLSTGTCDDDELPHRPDFFHLMFALASCYMVSAHTEGVARESVVRQ